MLKYFLFLASALIISSTSAQINFSFYNKVEITFNDGKKLSGIGKISGHNLKFKKFKKDTKQIFHFRDLKQVDFGHSTYVYLKFEEKYYLDEDDESDDLFEEIDEDESNYQNIYRIVEIAYEGKEVTLYKTHQTNYMPATNSMFMGHSYTTVIYYVKKLSEEYPQKLRPFRKKAMLFFKDCEVLVRKIKKRELKYDDLEYIVKHYDQWCYK